MQILFRRRHLDDDPRLQPHVERRLRFALGKFGNRVRKATVVLEDENGPRSGVDLVCRMTARLEGGGEIIVEGQGEEVEALIDRTADRLGQSVGRELQRRLGERGAVPAV
jgi:ribosome-associated translation inhibitor RaiA